MKSWMSPLAIVALMAVHWATFLVQAESIICDNPELCLSKRFLRFGRGPRAEDPFYRISRQFVRFGRAYRPYHDKRYLRFGRSQQPNVDDIYNKALLQLEEPYSRKRRSPDADSQLKLTHNQFKRSPDQSEYHEGLVSDDVSNAIKKRSVDDDDMSTRSGDVIDRDLMGLGLATGDGGTGNAHNDLDKRFVRFGKRLIPAAAKRFMRFGRNDNMLGASKRFMRFGKRKMGEEEHGEPRDLSREELNEIHDVLSLADQLKSQTGQKNELVDKRFMRFGKREDGTERA